MIYFVFVRILEIPNSTILMQKYFSAKYTPIKMLTSQIFGVPTLIKF